MQFALGIGVRVVPEPLDPCEVLQTSVRSAVKEGAQIHEALRFLDQGGQDVRREWAASPRVGRRAVVVPTARGGTL